MFSKNDPTVRMVSSSLSNMSGRSVNLNRFLHGEYRSTGYYVDEEYFVRLMCAFGIEGNYLTQQQKHFIAVIAGEAIGANAMTQKAVAHTIMNRLYEPRDVWRNATSVNDVLIRSQYNAVGEAQYVYAMSYMDNRDGSNATYENLISTVLPIYHGREADFTQGAHYIFNAGHPDGARLDSILRRQPGRYVTVGPFYGVDDIAYRMYRALW